MLLPDRRAVFRLFCLLFGGCGTHARFVEEIMRPMLQLPVVLAFLMFTGAVAASEKTFRYRSITAVRNIDPQKTD